MKSAHQRFTNCCQGCLLGFNDCHLYVQHMTSVHHLPVLAKHFQPRDTPSESVFRGELRKFESTEAEESNNLENFMRIPKPKIDTLISYQLTQGPPKVQLCAKFGLSNFCMMSHIYQRMIVLKYTQTLWWLLYTQMDCRMKRIGKWWRRWAYWQHSTPWEVVVHSKNFSKSTSNSHVSDQFMVHHTSRCRQNLLTVEGSSTLGTMKTEIASAIALWRLITCIIK